MQRPVLTVLTSLAITTLGIIVGACASSETTDDGLEAIATEGNATESTNDSDGKLPDPSTQASKDAGDSAKDPGNSAKDASPPPKDAPTPPPSNDAGTSPASIPGDCDPNDPLYMLEFMMLETYTPCPCSTVECCYAGVACVPL